ncbi:SH3 domain-containing protein [Streptomyces sp. TRM 70361]|uniref:SH3 domain-containing protein n=1 Tax=Streptomyces sp. TRM 70361 TaxID=3116553 RepID=UPI002E7B5CD2|nr:SH3 domain-containing protein [Streptomyces sp. TRM 70361]MEE1941513.1 SH3 domain-containing protein [Streptomyces sp. TRM 70361]
MFGTKTRRTAARTAGTLLTAALLGGTVLTGTAQAHPALPYGTVTAPSGVYERQYPSTDSHVVGGLAYRAQVGLKCKVRAQNIDGNPVWYLLRDRQAWVAARYVANTGSVPYCNQV